MQHRVLGVELDRRLGPRSLEVEDDLAVAEKHLVPRQMRRLNVEGRALPEKLHGTVPRTFLERNDDDEPTQGFAFEASWAVNRSTISRTEPMPSIAVMASRALPSRVTSAVGLERRRSAGTAVATVARSS